MNSTKSSLFSILLVLTVTAPLSAQIIYPPGYVNMNLQSGGLVVPINNYMSKDESDRELFIDDQWNEGTIVLLSGDSINHYLIKYNLATEAIEVKTNQAIKVVPLGDARLFYWFENGQRFDFINGNGYSTDDTPRTGYLQVLAEGDINLFKKTHLSVQKANYRPELDVGSPEDKVVEEEVYYVARGKSIMRIKNKKKVYDFFKQHRTEVKKHAQRQGWNPKREADLVAIVSHYNGLMEQKKQSNLR